MRTLNHSLPWTRRVAGQRGVTLVEITASLAIMGIFLAVAVPAVGNYIRSSRVRTAADLLSRDISQVRYAAVTSRRSLQITLVGSVPASSYTWQDVKGTARTVQLPTGVTISAASNVPLTFNTMGALAGSPAVLVIHGPYTPTKAVEHTLSVGVTGKVTQAVNLNAAP